MNLIIVLQQASKYISKTSYLKQKSMKRQRKKKKTFDDIRKIGDLAGYFQFQETTKLTPW